MQMVRESGGRLLFGQMGSKSAGGVGLCRYGSGSDELRFGPMGSESSGGVGLRRYGSGYDGFGLVRW